MKLLKFRSGNGKIFEITFTGMMLALVILLQYLQRFMPFGEWGYVKFNLGIIFIFTTAFIVGFQYAFLILIIRFVVGPAIGSGYNLYSIIGHLQLFVSNLLVLIIYILVALMFWKKTLLTYIIAAIITVCLTSFILSILNAVFFVPWYWNALLYIPNISISEAKQVYPSVKWVFFGLPTYWQGMIATYFTFNVINISFALFVFYPLNKIVHFYQSVGHSY